MFVISRIEHYKFSEAAAVYAESERKLKNYINPDWDPDKVEYNYHVVSPMFNGSFENYLSSVKRQLKCRMITNPDVDRDKQTNVLSQAIFSASPEFFEGMSRLDIIQYYSRCYHWFIKRYPSVEIVSAVIHFDETTPHMHLNFLPIIKKHRKNGKACEVFSSSTLFEGKHAYSEYQDAFYEHISFLYPDKHIDRKGEVQHEHLSVCEYKQAQAKLSALNAEIATAQNTLTNLRTVIEETKDAKPGLKMIIENAELKKQLSWYQKFVQYIKRTVPTLYEQFFERSGTHERF